MEKINEFSRLIGVVLLQDMRTRFGASYLSYLIAIAWPLTHLTFLVSLYIFRTSVSPIGDSQALFVLTGVIPFIFCIYPCRFIGMTITQNRQLLSIPALRPMHLILGRSILEVLNSAIVLAIFVCGMLAMQIDIVPAHASEAGAAVGAVLFLGVSLGFFTVMATAVGGGFVYLFLILSLTVLYIFSGVYIPASTLPENYIEYMEYNPLFHLVEWLRSSYYISYQGEPNKIYVIFVAGVLLTVGLIGERFIRNKLISTQ